MIKTCRQCSDQFETNGKELYCAPWCKMDSMIRRVQGDRDCWILISNYNRMYSFKYGKRFYNARSLILKHHNIDDQEKCEYSPTCINPRHLKNMKPDKIGWLEMLKSYVLEAIHGIYK